MARAELIDHKRVRVEAENDDTYIIDFMGGLNYLINGRSDNALLGFQGEMFDKQHDGDMNTVRGVSRYFEQTAMVISSISSQTEIRNGYGLAHVPANYVKGRRWMLKH